MFETKHLGLQLGFYLPGLAAVLLFVGSSYFGNPLLLESCGLWICAMIFYISWRVAVWIDVVREEKTN